jgi:predicted PurR-regulated permease PerM
VGGALWGIPGIFLSLPLIAVLKVIFDRLEPLKPVGFLLGDLSPPDRKKVLKRHRKKASQKK